MALDRFPTGTLTLPSSYGVDGDAYFEIFSGVVQGAFEEKDYFMDSSGSVFDTSEMAGTNVHVDQLMGGVLGKEWTSGSSLASSADGANDYLQNSIQGELKTYIDKLYNISQGVYTYDAKQTADQFVKRGLRIAKDMGEKQRKVITLRKFSTIIQGASMPDPAYGGGRKTKTQAGSAAGWPLGPSSASLAARGCYLDSTLSSDGYAIQQMLARWSHYLDELEAPEGPENRWVWMRPAWVNLLILAAGTMVPLTASAASGTRTTQMGMFSERFVNLPKLQVYEYAGFTIIKCVHLSTFGTTLNTVETANLVSARKGSKYCPGDDGSSAGTPSGLTIPSLNGSVWGPQSGTVFDTGAAAGSPGSPTTWNGTGAKCLDLFNNIGAVGAVRGTCREKVMQPRTIEIHNDWHSKSIVHVADFGTGYGVGEPQGCMYATTALVS